MAIQSAPFQLLTSRDNPLFKQLKLLAGSAVARKKHGLCVLEGIHLAQVCLAQGFKPDYALFGESALAQTEVAALLAQLDATAKKLADRATSPIRVLSDKLLAELSTLDTQQGVLFLLSTPQPHLPASLTQNCVVLDGVQDPGNVGSILRSAAAAGIRHVLALPGTAALWSPKVLRAGMGAHFALQLYDNINLVDMLSHVAVPYIATSSHHHAQTVFHADLQRAVAWIMGNEGAGVSDTLAAHVAQWVTIPQPGGEESLNVAAAAAVCFFEQVRQNLPA